MTPEPSPDMEIRNERIRKFLDWPGDEALVEDVGRMAAILAERHPHLCSRVLHAMGRAVDRGIRKIEKTGQENWNAMERAVQMMKMPFTGAEDYVVQATPVVKALFPDGTCEVPWGSEITRDFYYLWINYLRECPDLAESEWARGQGYRNYMKKALDPATEKPETKEPEPEHHDHHDLQEAIKHSLEIAEHECGTECGDQHAQLAQWLIELNNRRKQ